jgi:hypothetical protein
VYLGQDAPDKFRYDLVGDEAHAHVARWLQHGGAFHEDLKLQQEMKCTRWTPVRRKRGEREVEVLSATRKDGPKGYRAMIHRSPDRLDMLRVFAYAAYMRDALPMPDERSEAEKVDEEVLLPDVDPKEAFRDYMRSIKGGRHNC